MKFKYLICICVLTVVRLLERSSPMITMAKVLMNVTNKICVPLKR